MKKVLMLVALGGLMTSISAGETVEFEDEEEAQRHVDAGHGKFVEEAENEDELAELKAKADELGIKYTKKTTVEEFTKLIEEVENK